MVTMPGYAEYSRTYDNVSGLHSVREAIERVRPPAYLERTDEQQRHITRLTGGLDAARDAALARDQNRAVADLAKHIDVQLAIPENVAEAFTVAGSRHLAEIKSCLDITEIADAPPRNGCVGG